MLPAKKKRKGKGKKNEKKETKQMPLPDTFGERLEKILAIRLDKIVHSNSVDLWQYANSGYATYGRGAITETFPSLEHLLLSKTVSQQFVPEAVFIKTGCSEQIRQLIATYDPTKTFVHVHILRIKTSAMTLTQTKTRAVAVAELNPAMDRTDTRHRPGDAERTAQRLRLMLEARKKPKEEETETKDPMQTIFSGILVSRDVQHQKRAESAPPMDADLVALRLNPTPNPDAVSKSSETKQPGVE